jgi:hypothetical protein
VHCADLLAGWRVALAGCCCCVDAVGRPHYLHLFELLLSLAPDVLATLKYASIQHDAHACRHMGTWSRQRSRVVTCRTWRSAVVKVSKSATDYRVHVQHATGEHRHRRARADTTHPHRAAHVSMDEGRPPRRSAPAARRRPKDELRNTHVWRVSHKQARHMCGIVAHMT